MRLAVALLALLAPALAAASPNTAGVSAGVLHDEVDREQDGNRTLGLFGRIAVSPRVAGQLELVKIDAERDDGLTTRAATALLVFDLASRGRLVPTLLAGLGIDHASDEYGGSESGRHVEGGLGLEYRAAGGLTVGIDLRIGTRSVEEPEAYPVIDRAGRSPGVTRPEDTFCGIPEGCTGDDSVAWGALREGEYRALRVTVGIAF